MHFAGETAKPEYSYAILGFCLIWLNVAKLLFLKLVAVQRIRGTYVNNNLFAGDINRQGEEIPD